MMPSLRHIVSEKASHRYIYMYVFQSWLNQRNIISRKYVLRILLPKLGAVWASVKITVKENSSLLSGPFK